MTEHRDIVAKTLISSSSQARALFALLCAERLRQCCWAWLQVNDLDPIFYDNLIHELAQKIGSKSEIDIDPHGSMSDEIEALIPVDGEPLTVQAQSGLLCLQEVISQLKGERPSGIVCAVNALIDAHDNYYFSVRNRLANDFSSPPLDHPLMLQELARQRADANFVIQLEQLSAQDILARRIENMQFVVPIAF